MVLGLAVRVLDVHSDDNYSLRGGTLSICSTTTWSVLGEQTHRKS